MLSLFGSHMSNPPRHIFIGVISLALHAGLIFHFWQYEPVTLMGTGATTQVVNVQIFPLQVDKVQPAKKPVPVLEIKRPAASSPKPKQRTQPSAPKTQPPPKPAIVHDSARDSSSAIAAPSVVKPTEAEGLQNYASHIWQKIAEHGSKGIHVEGRVVVNFSLTLTGEIRTLRIAQSSGNDALDARALSSIRQAAPFGPTPANISEADLVFDIPFHFH